MMEFREISKALSDWSGELDSIADKLGGAELLAGLAEEAAELAQAALKLRRAMTQLNPTPVTVADATERLREELADVLLCAVAFGVDEDAIERFVRQKAYRWSERLEGQPHQFARGDEVWVLERDEDRCPCSVCGYMFLAQAGEYAIVTGWINDLDDAEEILEYHVEETWNNYDTDLAVFWMKDCYATQEEAHAVLGEASLCEEDDSDG